MATLRETLAYEPVELGFGTSGLRGLVRDITDLECYINVIGFLEFLKNHDELKQGERIYIAGDLRDSTHHIMQVIYQACREYGLVPVNCGRIPTPAVAYFAYGKDEPSIMVTGSHIPSDRNGIKFNKRAGEVLKADEDGIHEEVAKVRSNLYSQDSNDSPFDQNGALKQLEELPEPTADAEAAYIARFLDVFPSDCLKGKKVVVYQQSAVGRDIIIEVLGKLGAEVVPVGRSEAFIPIDTENVTEQDKQLFRSFAAENPGLFAIVSTDGDSDRPFVIDELGNFHRGDLLGCVVAKYLDAKFAALPISGNDAADEFCQANGIKLVHTRIGSPYIISAMQEGEEQYGSTVSWEVNGGFVQGTPVTLEGKTLSALPTRDALLPILCALLAAIQDGGSVSELFAKLPRRYTGGGLLDDIPLEKIKNFKQLCTDETSARNMAEELFFSEDLGTVESIDLTDGLRIEFSSTDVIHLRPSGNAPQFRVYTTGNTQERADQLADQVIRTGFTTILQKL